MRLKKREFDMILHVTDPPFLEQGAEVNSTQIQEDIRFEFGEEIPTRQIGLAISWSLNTSFDKERDSQGRYTFVRVDGEMN